MSGPGTIVELVQSASSSRSLSGRDGHSNVRLGRIVSFLILQKWGGRLRPPRGAVRNRHSEADPVRSHATSTTIFPRAVAFVIAS
ncbi:hypothetical protein BX589_11769 [Paraburkholderia fungorum]|jgi:hypothetical protein|nr:hypothetical protein BX589_11769 [Paraburkholderia fungorum]